MTGIIYKATNLFNGKVYIGQTRRSLEIRMRQHLQGSLKADSTNSFHYALAQFGREGFEWSIVDEFRGTKEEVMHALNIAEEYHILKNRSMVGDMGYNSTQGGYSSGKFADSVRKKINADCRNKAILQYDLDGNFLREFESVSEACEAVGCKNVSAYLVTQRPWRGYQWRYREGLSYPKKINAFKKVKRNGPVIAYTPDGNFYKEYECAYQCCEDLGKEYQIREEVGDITLKSNHMVTMFVFKKRSDDYPKKINVNIIYPRYATRKKLKSADIPVLQYTRDGVFVKEHPSIIAAYRDTATSESTIRRYCQMSEPFTLRDDRTKYIWRFKDGDIKERVEVVRVKREEKPKREHRVLQYSKDGSFIRIWDNIHQACLDSGDTIHYITWSLSGKNTKKTKFQWRKYEEGFPSIIPAV